MNAIKSYLKELGSSIRCFKSSPFKNAAYLMNFAVLLASAIIWIIMFAQFVRDGGYNGDVLFSLGTVCLYGRQCSYTIWGLAVAAVLCFIGQCRGEERPVMKNTLKIAGISYIVLPIALLLVENIVGIFVTLFFLGIGGFMLFFNITGSSDVDEKPQEYHHIDDRGHSKQKKEKNPKAKIVRYSGNCKFYRGKGGLGLLQAQADAIYMDGNLTKHSYVCTVDEFQTSKVEIYLNGERVTCI